MSFVFFLIATVLFVLAGLKVDTSFDLIAWGLAALAAGHMVGGLSAVRDWRR